MEQRANWPAERWRQWMAERLSRRLATFRNEPEEMIGAFERERASVDNYRGRQILELLQNADDAGVGFGHNSALIRWWPEGMCVANTGIPFCSEGVDSLIVSNLSPKKIARCRQIGNRGLGFRSVLAWSSCPFILSGNLSLVLSPLVAAASLKQLADGDEQVRKKVEEWKRSGHETPIPILSCPAVVDSDEFVRVPDKNKEYWRLMWERARQLRTTYDTVVALPFTEPGAGEEAKEQVNELKVELLLFLQYLTEVAIETPDGKRGWRAERQRESVTVTAESEVGGTATWRIFHELGTIPDEFLTLGQKGTSALEIRIAIREGVTQRGFLYNYFPTNVRFPYPVVAHATMELTPNRQNLVETPANRYMVERLADTMAAVAEQSADPAHPWRALDLICFRGMSVDPVLERMGFNDTLLNVVRRKKIVPRRDGAFDSPTSVKRVPADTEGWLPLKQFEDIVLPTDDYSLSRTLDWLEIKELSADEFRIRVQKLSGSLTLDERAALLAGIIRHRGSEFVAKEPPPALLTDESGAPIDHATTAYFPPLSEVAFKLPAWMSMKFVSARLVERVVELLGYSRERLAEELRKAGYTNVYAYDFRGVARALVAQTDARCSNAPERTDEIRLDGIRALKSLWAAAGGREAPQREPTLQVELPTRSQGWRNAEELYVGTPYLKGDLMEALLGTLHPELFVASPEAFGLDKATEKLENFLLWLGVGQLPRQEIVTCYAWKDREYLEHVCQGTKYPIEFGDCTASSPNDLNLVSVRVTSIRHVCEILDRGDPHAILGWVAGDDRFRNWSRHGDTTAELTARFKARTERTSSHSILSYVLWLLQKGAWLPTTNGEKRAPAECVLARTTAAELQKIFPRPALNPRASVLQSLHIDEGTLNQALMVIGVRITLEDITWEQWYDLMVQLPKIDPDGKAATRVYRILAEKPEDEDPGSAARVREEEFKAKGKLWACTNGEWAYVPVSRGVYLPADATIPKAVVDHFPVIDLPKRRGLEKIKRVFGVKVLRTRDMEVAVDQFDKVPRSDVLNDELQRLKPYVLAVRLDATPDVVGLAQFKRLRIMPCSRVSGRARVNDRDVDISLPDAGRSLVVDDMSYLIVPPNVSEPFLQDAMVARHVANILAEVLDVERTSDFAQLALANNHEVRGRVLSDILGRDAEQILAQARDTLQINVEQELQPGPAWETLTTGPAEEQLLPVGEEPVSEMSSMLPRQAGKELRVPEQVEAKAQEREPTERRRMLEKHGVTTRRSTRERVQQARKVTDGDRCEELAGRFEESQGRFPLRVSALQGTKGFGCDILSFSTGEDRERFMESEGKSGHLIQRFIEVKGRSAPKGTVPLEGNELEAARVHREKYYIYRVYEELAGQEWELVELPNPVDYHWPISYAVDAFGCPATKYWTVTAVEPQSQKGGQ